MSSTVQTSFNTKEERAKGVLRRAAQQYDFDHVILAVSGGTDSVVAADVTCRYGPEFGIEPDAVTFIDTGAGVPQTELVARTIAEIHDLEFIKHGYRNRRESLAVRVVNNGWPGEYPGSPATGGHGLEWANRKSKPMEGVYMLFDGLELWVSGARKLESKKRSGNVPDSGIEKDKPRRVWASVIGGWSSHEKREYIREHGLPVSESYLFLGFSGECTACAFDSMGLLTSLDLLCPELSYCIRSLTVWLYQRTQRSCAVCETIGTNEDDECERCGRLEIAPKRLCWGWLPEGDMDHAHDLDTAQEMVGCDPESCGGEVNTKWIQDLPDEQLVTRKDVLQWWDGHELPERFPI